jgi:hypothetical protein
VKWLVGAVSAAALAGCGTGQTGASNADPPTVVCGTTLSDSAAGPVLIDAVHHHTAITEPSVGGLIFVQVSDDCAHGARVTWAPAQAASLVKRAPARDGLDAAVVLRPAVLTATFTVSARRNGTVVAHVPIALGGRPTDTPHS